MKWISVPPLLLILLFGCDKAADKPITQKHNSIPAGEMGSTLPSFLAKDLSGETVASADLKSKVVIIDFWATWCAPCRTEMPGYQSLLEKYGSRGLVVIGFKVDFMQDSEDPVQFLKETGVHYPIAIGSEDIRKKFGEIQGLPTTFIYDRKGILQRKIIGFEYTNSIEDTIKQLL